MKYYIIAGEASGDLHGSNLIKQLKEQDTQADFRCWGGDLMQAAGGHIVRHYKDLAFMGFVEVLTNLRTIFRNLDFCKQDILEYRPDALILIDYPGFNLRIAKWAHTQRLAGTPTQNAPTPGSQAAPRLRIIYYISPQVWAWKENRVKQIRATVDKMLVILPFEKEFYKKWNYEVEYVGHPLVEVIDGYHAPAGAIPAFEKPIVALLPGSRKSEIKHIAPRMLEAAGLMHRQRPGLRFILPIAPGMRSLVEPLVARHAPGVQIDVLEGRSHDALAACDVTLVASGTATLEAALFKRPMVITYVLNWFNAKRMDRMRYQPWVGLPNVLCRDFVVPELLQDKATPQAMARETIAWLDDPARCERVRVRFHELHHLLRRDTVRESADAIAQVLQA